MVKVIILSQAYIGFGDSTEASAKAKAISCQELSRVKVLIPLKLIFKYWGPANWKGPISW